MTNILDFGEPDKKNSIIKVIGVGGGGGNAVNHMYREGIHDVNFVLCNTDAQALNDSPVPVHLQLGKEGLGAGNKPERAKEAGVEVATINPGRFSAAVRTSGVLSPAGSGSATIASRTAGILAWSGGTPVPGQRVGEKEVMARISAGGMGEGDAVTRAAIAYEAAKTEYDRARALLEDKIISQREFTAMAYILSSVGS